MTARDLTIAIIAGLGGAAVAVAFSAATTERRAQSSVAYFSNDIFSSTPDAGAVFFYVPRQSQPILERREDGSLFVHGKSTSDARAVFEAALEYEITANWAGQLLECERRLHECRSDAGVYCIASDTSRDGVVARTETAR